MGEAKRRKGNSGHLKVVADNTATIAPREHEQESKLKTAASTASREADLEYARNYWRTYNPSPGEIAHACMRRDQQAARGSSLGAPPKSAWGSEPAIALFRGPEADATLGRCLAHWCLTSTVDEFNEELGEGPPHSLSEARELLRDLRFVARAMTHANLSATIAGIRAELAVFEAEKRLRQEEVATHYKDQHRVLVDLEDRLAPGDIITNKAGAEMTFSYFGQPWEMTEGAALRHGRPDLVGRTVRYAYGKPIGGVIEHDLDAKGAVAAKARSSAKKPKAASKLSVKKPRQSALPLPTLTTSGHDIWPTHG